MQTAVSRCDTSSPTYCFIDSPPIRCIACGLESKRTFRAVSADRNHRDWPSHNKIVETLRTMDEEDTLVIQSGKPIGLIRTPADAPIVIMANCNMVGQWAKAI